MKRHLGCYFRSPFGGDGGGANGISGSGGGGGRGGGGSGSQVEGRIL